MFKCMYKHGVCGEGHHFRDESQRGPYFNQGVTQVAFYNPIRKEYDGFCPAHAKAARTQYDHAMRVWNASNPQPTAAQQLRRLPAKEKRGRPAGAAVRREMSAPLAVGLAPGADVWHQLMSFLPGTKRY